MSTKSDMAPQAGTAPQARTGELDYDAPDTLVVDQPEQLRALADDLRTQIIALLRERAFSTQQLSRKLGIPKGTVGHHLKVLEQAGLIRVVRTRKVRAVTEKFYGRTARLFLFHAEDPADARALGATVLRHAAGELERAPASAGFGHPKARLSDRDVRRLERRLERLMDDFLAADAPGGEPYALAAAFYRRPDA
jgi:DNA-binding transcriptional ArsR family regulator